MAQPPAFVFHLRSAYLDVHRCPGNHFHSGFAVGKQGPHPARLCALLVPADHEDDLLAHESDRAGQDRHVEAAMSTPSIMLPRSIFRCCTCICPSSSALPSRKNCWRIRLWDGTSSGRGRFALTSRTRRSRSAAFARRLKSLKSGMPLVIFPEGGRTPDGEIKPFLAGSIFSGDQGAGGYCAGGAGRNLRTAAHEHLPHQMPAAGDAGGSAYFNRRIHAAKHGRAFGSGAPGGGGFVFKTSCQDQISVVSSQLSVVHGARWLQRSSSTFSAIAYFRSSIPLPVTAEMGNNSRSSSCNSA